MSDEPTATTATAGTPPSAPAEKTLAGSDGVRRASALPTHFPGWATRLAELYFSGTTSMFVLHGNVFDLCRLGPADAADVRWGSLSDFLAEQLFGRWDLLLHYDLARGIRCVAGSNAKRLADMVEKVEANADKFQDLLSCT